MSLYTIPQYIQFGDATTFLMGNYNNEGVLFGGRLTVNQSPDLVAMVTDAIRWQYEGSPSDSTLPLTAQYLYWLCGKFQLEAKAVINSGGGTSGLVPVSSPQNPIEFLVDSTSIIPSGGSSVTLPQFIGYNLLFDRGGQPQTQLTSESTYFRWNKVTGLFTAFPSANAGELFSLNPT